jgi:hypothetical protein
MHKTFYLVFAILVVGAGSPIFAVPEKKEGQQAEAEPSIRLFNGHDLSGWYVYTENTQYENPGVFQVVDGKIYVPGGKDDVAYYGGLITRDAYENYRLKFDFKWGQKTYGRRKDKARDAGVLLHCVGPNGPGPWMNSYEFQIIEGGVGDMLVVNNTKRDDAGHALQITCVAPVEMRDDQPYFKPDGLPKEFVDRGRLNWWGRAADWKDEVGVRGKDDPDSAVGEWTRCEIVAAGDELTYYVNDKLVNHIQKLSHTKGKLLFQTEGAEIWYRDLELTPLK